MALTYPWLGLAVALGCVLVWLVARLTRPGRRRSAADPTLLAHADRLRALPRFRTMTRHRLRWLTAELSCVALACAGAALLTARPVETAVSADELATRDIVLCLDVSGSMAAVDRQVITSYLDLAKRLDGERIGFTLFDSSAVTIFPLTDDAAYIAEQLTAAASAVGQPLAGTRLGGGSSLIGDGLASCVQRFDHADEHRSRTIVLATDNQVAGRQLFTLKQAADKAKERGIMVFGVVPGDNSPAATANLMDNLKPTGGDVLLLTAARATDPIADAIEAKARVAAPGRSRSQAKDLVWPGALATLLGLAGLVAIRGWRR